MTVPSAAPRVLFYVQHLLGIGHIKRAALICRALAEAGLDIGGARLHQLPPLRSADMTFSALLDEDDRPIDAAWQDRRREIYFNAVTNARI